jgi:hypothetical protein
MLKMAKVDFRVCECPFADDLKILNVPVLTTEQHPRGECTPIHQACSDVFAVFGSTVPELKYDELEELQMGIYPKTG